MGQSCMWTCEACGRSFAHKNQDHFCGEAPQTIADYIALQPPELQPRLQQLYDTLRVTLPEAQERISWQMPTFWNGKNIIHFAAFKKHTGIYPSERAVAHFAERLTENKTSKGAIQFPHSAPLPLPLIAEITAWCAAQIGA